jgi:hypothetical protein
LSIDLTIDPLLSPEREFFVFSLLNDNSELF